jgi:hypothetical protein
MSDSRQVLPEAKEWAAYIRGESVPERAEWLESLLLDDEQAFELYMQVLDAESAVLPVLESPELFAQNVMNQIGMPEIKAVNMETKKCRRRFYEHRLFHYVIAASLTLIFLSAGWFDKLTPGPNLTDKHAARTPFSEELVKVTTGWLDRLKP